MIVFKVFDEIFRRREEKDRLGSKLAGKYWTVPTYLATMRSGITLNCSFPEPQLYCNLVKQVPTGIGIRIFRITSC
jgi:hypothetical protein